MNQITRRDLMKMTDQELIQLLRDLGQYLDTPDEQQAKHLRRAILDEQERRGQWGF